MVIHGDKLRWLLWLRWRMLTRGFVRGGAMYIIGAVLQILFSVGIAGIAAVVTFFLYRNVAVPGNAELLFIVLTSLYVIWIVLPIFDIGRNEGLDLSKLALFPLTRGELILSLLLSTLLDIPMLGLFFMLLAVVAGWSLSVPLLLISLLTMLIFAAQLVGISQLVLSLFQNVLQNRRFRDLRIIFTFLIFAAIYLGQFLIRNMVTSSFSAGLQNSTFSQFLQWTPPGVAARIIQQASVNNWNVSLLWLGAHIIITVLILYLWLTVTERGLTASEEGGSVRAIKTPRLVTAQRTEARPVPASQPALTVRRTGLLPTPITALMLKDLKYLRRDPQMIRMVLQSLIIVVFYVIYFGLTSFGSGNRHNSQSLTSLLGPWAVMIAPAFMLVSLYILTYNVLGFERQSLTTLFLFPIKPLYILWGKNLLAFIIGLTGIVILIILAALFSHAWLFVLPALVVGIAGVCVMIGVGNLTSVLLPQRMRFGARGFRALSNLSAEGGCLRAILSGFAFYGTLFVLIPVILAVVLPVIFGTQWLWVITLPLSLLYGGSFYFVVTLLVAPRILKKAPELLNIIAKE